MKWEYQTVKMATHTTFIAGKLDEAALDKVLNGLGGQEWELVAVFPRSQTIGETRDVAAAFKRQVAG